jgi:hypothetical protein
MTTVAVPEIYRPSIIQKELICVIGDTARNSPRSGQRLIGPSEMDMACAWRMLHALAQDKPDPLTQPVPWLATIGTAVHAWLADAFIGSPLNAAVAQPRFLVEQRVTVGSVAGQEIAGSCDLFDIDAGTVIDWKIVGASRLALYARKGPGRQYRSQIHLYGRGLANAGHHVRYVMIAFLPRNEALNKAYFWSEQYDESVALAALSRAEGFYNLIQQIGLPAALSMYPPCAEPWCPWCSRANKPTSVAALMSQGRKSQ